MIAWGHEHKLRALNLAAAVGETALDITTLIGASATIPLSSDTTLSIWGHGGATTFAELGAKDMADLIKAWKKKNPTLTTVEMITCDVRHATDDCETFTDQLMPFLIDSAAGKVLVNVKTLPRGGKSAATSELYATEASGSDGYYFIAADTDSALQVGVQVFQAAYAQVTALPATKVGTVYKAVIPIAKAANDKAAMKGPLSYVATGGLFPSLRGLLVSVTAYSANGKIVAVPKVFS